MYSKPFLQPSVSEYNGPLGLSFVNVFHIMLLSLSQMYSVLPVINLMTEDYGLYVCSAQFENGVTSAASHNLVQSRELLGQLNGFVERMDHYSPILTHL